MHRSLDFTPVDDEVIVSRILMQLHQAIDETFPNAQPASARFARTAFAGYDEPTLTQVAPSEAIREAQEAARLEFSGEDPLTPESRSRSSKKQTVIGLVIFIVIAIVGYFVMQR